MSTYLDHAATTPARPQAVAAFAETLTVAGNPSSTHAAGRRARDLVEDARERIARALGCEPAEVILTAGGTEADNLAIAGLMRGRRRSEPERDRLVVSAIEHPAVLEAADALALGELALGGVDVGGVALDGVPGGVPAADAPTAEGIGVHRAKVTAEGVLDLDALDRHLRSHGSRTGLVSVMWANNETGVIQPVVDVVALAAAHGAWVHSDAVQAIGHVPVDFAASGLDAMSVSGHKLGAPVGIGALVARRELTIAPVEHGGGQERGVRSGTVNAAGAVALAAALETALAERDSEAARLRGMRDRLVRGILEAIPGARLTGPVLDAPLLDAPARRDRLVARLPQTAHLTFEGCESEALLFGLDMAGVQASSGSACQAGVEGASHVLLAMGHDEAGAGSAIRFTFGWTSREADVDAVLGVLPSVVERARAAAAVRRPR